MACGQRSLSFSFERVHPPGCASSDTPDCSLTEWTNYLALNIVSLCCSYSVTGLAYDWSTAYSIQWILQISAEGFLLDTASVPVEVDSSSVYANLRSHWSISHLSTWKCPCYCSGTGSLPQGSKLLWSRTCFRTFLIENSQPLHSAV